MVVINALWVVMMLIFASAAATSLDLLGTNPLGLFFLLIFGFLFLLQFMAMLWHRCGAFVEAMAGLEPFPHDFRQPRVRATLLDDNDWVVI